MMQRNKKQKNTEQFMRRTSVVWFGAFICCLLWGSAFPCIKIGYQMMEIDAADWASQILYAGYRFALAGILVIAIGSAMQHRLLVPSGRSWGRVTLLSMFQTVGQYVFFYIGLAHTSGVKSSIIVGTNAFVAILIASLFRQEHLTLRKIAGCVLGFGGVLLVTLNGSGLDMNIRFTGEGFVFLCTIAYACSSVLLKKYAVSDDTFLLSGWQFFIGGVIMIAAGLMCGGHVDGFTFASVLLLIYMALISAVAYTLWGILLKYNPISRVAVFGFMNPVIGVILSAILLNEAGQVAAGKCAAALALVCAGICMVNLTKSNRSSNE